MILRIRILGDPVLRTATRAVEAFDRDLAAFAADLVETMYVADGVGLAAPQVGDARRIAVVDVGGRRDGSEALVLVNPRVLAREGRIQSEEGCLSIPGLVETIERSARVTVEYQDLAGTVRTIEGEDLLGRALQHEIDHLDGILFIDHLGPLKRRMAVRDWKKARAEDGIEVPES